MCLKKTKEEDERKKEDKEEERAIRVLSFVATDPTPFTPPPPGLTDFLVVRHICSGIIFNRIAVKDIPEGHNEVIWKLVFGFEHPVNQDE